MSLFLALASLSLLALVAAIVFTVRRFLQLLRDAGAAADALGESLDRIAASADRAAAKGDSLTGAAERFEHALGRLDRSRARLDVLLKAYGDARTTLLSLVVVPRK